MPDPTLIAAPTAAPAAAPGASVPKRDKLRLGDVLVQQKLITTEQLEQHLALQRSSGRRLGRLLIEAGLITEETLAQALARQLRVPVVNLKTFPLKSETVRLLAEGPARRHRAVVLEDKGEQLLVGFADPLDLAAYDELSRILRRSLRVAVIPEGQLGPVLDRHYRRTDDISGLAKALEKDIDHTLDFGTLQETVGQEAAPVVKLLQSVFEDALQVGASDIHLEPQDSALAIRSRIDGLLQTQTHADKRIAAALTQRLKLMAGLDIAEKRLPQDGRFTLRLRDREIDVRLSTLPAQYGESVVLRLLGQSQTLRRLDAIGLPADMLTRLRDVLARHSGMLLVTGPTGSGKTTTLYAALAELDAGTQKIITVEDPIEYRLPGLTQVQVHEKIELSFARVLRATLRQDPDVILIGEMRDGETAEIGLRAAVTGHLVLSSLHTRNAAGTPFRLLDMGALPFMVASSLQAVVAQRLVRSLCDNCKTPQRPDAREALWLDAVGGPGAAERPVYRGVGCSHCNGIGFVGRTGVYEMLEMDAELAQAVLRSDPAAFAAAARARLAGRTMAHQAFELVMAGRTSAGEAMRLAADLD